MNKQTFKLAMERNDLGLLQKHFSNELSTSRTPAAKLAKGDVVKDLPVKTLPDVRLDRTLLASDKVVRHNTGDFSVSGTWGTIKFWAKA